MSVTKIKKTHGSWLARIVHDALYATHPTDRRHPIMSGKDQVRFVDLMRDTIEVHGLAWALRYYVKRMPMWELRFFCPRCISFALITSS